MPSDDYIANTRGHYQDADVARAYLSEYSRLTLGNISHHLIASGERRAVRRLVAPVVSELSSILDVPCGTGKLHSVLGDTVRIVAADVSIEMLTLAAHFYRRVTEFVQFARVDAIHLPFPDKSIDAVVSLRLLHRVPFEVKTAMIAEFKRVARKFVVLSLGVLGPWQSLRLAARQKLTGVRTIPYPIRRKEVKSLLDTDGWTIDAQRHVLPVLSAEVLYRLRCND